MHQKYCLQTNRQAVIYETKMLFGGISNYYQDILLAKLLLHAIQSKAASWLMS
jgi:hypothetical protein